jgi:hypothetical protein
MNTTVKIKARSRIREEENEKVRILDGRLAFLLSKLQTDEESRDFHYSNSV